jgi:asparagine synthase (glutamine-hydrolysing)
MLNHFFAFLKLGIFHPGLLLLSWRVKHQKKTYLTYGKLFSLASSFRYLQKRTQNPLEVTEFGVGRGGSAILLAWLVGHYGGRLTLFDVFGRIPAPTEKDGQRAFDRYQIILNSENDNYYGNIPDLIDLIKDEISTVCDLARVTFVQGKYEQTLPSLNYHQAFNLVHVDCDWYESSKAVFDFLQHHLHPGAILQVDDYSNWQGSHMAVDEAEWLKPSNFKLVDGALVVELGSKTGMEK